MLSFPTTRSPATAVVAGLRDVEPTAEALWWGARTEYYERSDPSKPWRAPEQVAVTRPMWLVGVMRYDPVARIAAARSIAVLEAMKLPPDTDQRVVRRWLDKRRWSGLLYQGFVPKFFWPGADLCWGAVREFGEMAWFAQHLFDVYRRAELARLEQEDASEQMEARLLALSDLVTYKMREAWQYTMGGRRSIIVPPRQAAA